MTDILKPTSGALAGWTVLSGSVGNVYDTTTAGDTTTYLDTDLITG